MPDTPSISLVTPTLNAARFLGEALESVAAQSVPGVEHIIADGGSTDETLAIVRAAVSRPTLLDGTDTGIYDGMNRGLAAASGEVIGILNADDRLAPGALNHVAEAFAATPSLETVTGGCIMIDGEGRETSRLESPNYPQCPASLLFGVPVINARFFRRSFLERTGTFDPAMGLGADRAFLWRLLQHRPAAAAIPAPLYLYRAHSGSSSLAGDPDTKMRIWREHLALADRLLAQADGLNVRVLLSWRALEGVKALRHLRSRGDREGAEALRHELRAGDRGWWRRLPRGLALWLKWRGRHSGI
ncbi:PGL/p-HBAD biosynthesis glycosyltransferase [Methyloligella halotolerans]|uniref:PGL/p-HBAD biosynthesis glycosyltransferase n=1 Tax=Methyloligella halotolerans TaxID=1177755 RepID=A0A1E2S2X8_9HYPH|nr:glycosyltransferase family 2 protein [Methyloligella halotolerans]ODA68685.1 PGL/p-HBAD biosynthesis glycosyltransferase [Methyloligella halotolerans]